MRIGVYAHAARSSGGIFPYMMTLLEMLRALDLQDEVVVLHRRRTDVPLRAFVGGRWSSVLMPGGLMDLVQQAGVAVVGELVARRVWYRVERLRANSAVRNPQRAARRDHVQERWYRDHGLDLVIYPVRAVAAVETAVPSMVSVHDLNHRVYTEFPEITAFGEFERREYYYRNAARTAATLLVDSETGREQLLEFYGDTGLERSRVVVLPVLPASTVQPASGEQRVEVLRRYGLSGGFLFYPAQFWPHKNHLRLIEALHHLKQTAQLTPLLVLAGSHSGSLRRRTFIAAMRAARRLGVADQVRYLGFIPDEHMSALYAEAAGLVMPTFFGPTNIPVVEAFAMGCPVVTSDLAGIREQTDGAAILVDPRSAEAIAEGVRVVLTSSDQRSRLIRRGRDVLARYTPEDYRRVLRGALEAIRARL